MFYSVEDTLRDIKALFNNAKDLRTVLEKYMDEHDNMRREIEQFQAQVVERMKSMLIERAVERRGIKVVKAVLPIEAQVAKDLVFKIREAIPQHLLCVVGSTAHEKPLLSIMLSDDMVKEQQLNAGQMVREAAKLISGGGGGQPHYASAGGKNLDGINAAIDKVIELAGL